MKIPSASTTGAVLFLCAALFLSPYVVAYTEQRYHWIDDMNATMLVAVFTYYAARPLAILMLAVYGAVFITAYRRHRPSITADAASLTPPA